MNETYPFEKENEIIELVLQECMCSHCPRLSLVLKIQVPSFTRLNCVNVHSPLSLHPPCTFCYMTWRYIVISMCPGVCETKAGISGLSFKSDWTLE